MTRAALRMVAAGPRHKPDPPTAEGRVIVEFCDRCDAPLNGAYLEMEAGAILCCGDCGSRNCKCRRPDQP